MLKKLTQTFTRSFVDQQFYPSKESFPEEWDYVQAKYGTLLTTTYNTDNVFEYKIIKTGEESDINDFVNDIVSETGKLHNRVIWCQNNNVTFTYEITEV